MSNIDNIKGRSSIVGIFNTVSESEVYGNIGRNILKLRKLAGMSQLEVGSKIGVTSQQVQKYESGKGAMYVHTLLNIAEIFNIDFKRLLEEDCTSKKIQLSSKYARSPDLSDAENDMQS